MKNLAVISFIFALAFAGSHSLASQGDDWDRYYAGREQIVSRDNQDVDYEIFVMDENDEALGLILDGGLSEEQIFGEGGVVEQLRGYDPVAGSGGGRRHRVARHGSCVASGGIASHYGSEGLDGNLAGSGEVFNQHALTAAHLSLKYGSLVRVTNVANGRTVVVKINDDGPHVGGRVIDLSTAAARAIGLELGRVQLDVLRCGGPIQRGTAHHRHRPRRSTRRH